MRTSTSAVTVLLALCLTACNGGDKHGSGNGSGNGNGHGTQVRAEGNSSASMNDNKHSLVDGAARFSQAKKELRVSLSSFELMPAQARK